MYVGMRFAHAVVSKLSLLEAVTDSKAFPAKRQTGIVCPRKAREA